MLILSPSILSADFAKLGEDVARAAEAGSEYIHIDVMDGAFVPNISFGMPVIKAIRPMTDKVFDVHLMIEEPHRYIKQFAENGADYITIHVEAESDIDGTLDTIKSYGVIPALSVKPNTPAEAVFPYLEKLGMILVMSVEPGLPLPPFREIFFSVRTAPFLTVTSGPVKFDWRMILTLLVKSHSWVSETVTVPVM